MVVRAKKLGWWMTESRNHLQLNWKTIDIGFRIFDYYCYMKHKIAEKEGPKNARGQARHIL